MKKLLRSFALLVAGAVAVRAQTVGSLPDKSPFTDLHDGQRFGVFAGMLLTGKDVAGVNPKSAPLFGVRYDLSVGGPAYLTGTIFGASTDRTVLDYTKSAATRNVGTQATGLLGFNIGLAVAATGERSWKGIQPLVDIGVGMVTAPGDKADISGYTLTPSFSFSYGAGVRWITGRNSELRVDLNQYWWELKYPETYRSTQGDPIAIKPAGALASWTANTALTLAWTLRAFR